MWVSISVHTDPYLELIFACKKIKSEFCEITLAPLPYWFYNSIIIFFYVLELLFSRAIVLLFICSSCIGLDCWWISCCISFMTWEMKFFVLFFFEKDILDQFEVLNQNLGLIWVKYIEKFFKNWLFLVPLKVSIRTSKNSDKEIYNLTLFPGC